MTEPEDLRQWLTPRDGTGRYKNHDRVDKRDLRIIARMIDLVETMHGTHTAALDVIAGENDALGISRAMILAATRVWRTAHPEPKPAKLIKTTIAVDVKARAAILMLANWFDDAVITAKIVELFRTDGV